MGTKKILTILFVFFAAIVSISAQKATYLTTEQLPNLIKCLPAPPAFDSPEFSNDIVRYAWGKQQRKDPKRAAIAKGDAIWDSINSLFHQFAVPFGLEVTLEGTPEIYKLLTTAIYTIDQMRDNLKTMAGFTGFTAAQAETLEQARQALLSVDSIGCTGCRYCVDGCPMNIPIPGIFSAMNERLIFDNTASVHRRYGMVTGERGKAADCIACGQCEGACPQQLPVIELLKKCSAEFDQ